MIKRVTFVRKRDDLTQDEFVAHWVGTHSVLARELDGVRGYRINVIDPATSEGTEMEQWNGIGELWFDDLAASEAAFAAKGAQLDADLVNFLSAKLTVFVDEHVIVAGGEPAFRSPHG